MRFQVLTAESKKVTVFWDVASCFLGNLDSATNCTKNIVVLSKVHAPLTKRC
jgi:hypothetical protein